MKPSNVNVPTSSAERRPEGVMKSYVSPTTNSCSMRLKSSITHSPGAAGARPSMMLDGLRTSSIPQLKTNCGGPCSVMVEPSGLIGWMRFSYPSPSSESSATRIPSTLAIASKSAWVIGSTFGSTADTPMSMPATTSVARSPKVSFNDCECGEREANLVRREVLDCDLQHDVSRVMRCGAIRGSNRSLARAARSRCDRQRETAPGRRTPPQRGRGSP